MNSRRRKFISSCRNLHLRCQICRVRQVRSKSARFTAMYTCRVCHRTLEAQSFAPSRLREGYLYCTKCCYRRYVRRDRAANPLLRVALQLDRRERRRRGQDKFKQLNPREVAEIVSRFGGCSAISGAHLEDDEICIECEDTRRPFHPLTNCLLLSKLELKQRLRRKVGAAEPASSK